MSAATTQAPPERDLAAAADPGLLAAARGYVHRVRGGEMGSLPAVLGIVVLCVVFSLLRPSFFSALNFANLLVQGASITVIAMGLVFVLLVGEIDLSAGLTSGVAGAVLAEVLTVQGHPLPVAVAAALLTGTAIGLTLGSLVAKIGIPSFVVTLAAFLGFQGVVLLIIGTGGNVTIRDSVILAIANETVPPALGLLLGAALVAGYALVQVLQRGRRRRQGVGVAPLTVIAVRIATLAAVTGTAVYILNLERSRNPALVSLRGVPVVVPLIVVLLLVLTFVLRRTAFGRHIYAVGGGREAARRSGIGVDRIRIAAFVIGSTMAAVGGIIAASRANSVDPNAGGSNTLLYAVGAAVIGGTSLFGGRGRVLNAILGGAVIAIIDNGMGLMGYSAGVRYVVTGVVLLVAAGVDALSRKRATASGRG
ncbi:MAG: sugar ABC transporter permease [Carbonactinosporaceae bacterium]